VFAASTAFPCALVLTVRFPCASESHPDASVLLVAVVVVVVGRESEEAGGTSTVPEVHHCSALKSYYDAILEIEVAFDMAVHPVAFRRKRFCASHADTEHSWFVGAFQVREPIDDQEALEVEAAAPVQHPVVAAMASNYQMEPSSSEQLSQICDRCKATLFC
jgi:hypothetical protein